MRVPLNQLLHSLSRALDFVEQELLGVTSNHGKRAAYVSARICRAMGLGEAEIFDMASCAILHDNALTAYGPGGIARLERFHSHCRRGEENAMVFPFVGDVAGIILHHHENWDGTGFGRLVGRDIPLRAMVLRLADNMDLNLHTGDGRPGLEQEIRRHAEKFKGRLYSPETVNALLKIVDADFVRDLTDERIDDALRRVIPSIRVDLSTARMLKICKMFAFIIDAKSPFTQNHSRGIAEKAGKLAGIFGIKGQLKDKLVVAAYLHDLGKLSTPLNILEKPGPLTDQEFGVMRNHAAVTEDILGQVSGLEDITTWCASHHEKLNGKGYPHGYSAKALHFEARLLACCDIYQALTEDRPYRPGMEHSKAVAIMEEMSAKGELDGGIVRIIKKEFAPAAQRQPALSEPA